MSENEFLLLINNGYTEQHFVQLSDLTSLLIIPVITGASHPSPFQCLSTSSSPIFVVDSPE